VSDHQRDIFMWRWSRDRAGGNLAALVWGVLAGSLVGFFWALAQGGAGADPLANPFLLVLPIAVVSFGSDFVSSQFWRKAIRVLVFATLLALIAVGRNFEMSWRIAIYVGIAAFVGATLASRSFRRDETRFQDLIREGIVVPQRRPIPAWSDLKAPGMFVLLCLAAFGPIYLLTLLAPHQGAR
jgi:hypothetical protein